MPENVIIIGSGPAGLTAAIYAARAGLNPLVIGGYNAGGQLMLTTDVENYPGFPKGVLGPEMMQLFREQAERFGARILDVDVTEVDFSAYPLRLKAEETWHEGRAVVVATGASAKWLELPNEQRLRGRGVSACATCDGFFFKGKEVAVVGGGDTAMEEALFLTKFATKVVVLHRRDEFRASKIMQERVLKHPKIEVRWNTVVTDVFGGEAVEGLMLKNVGSGKQEKLPTGGLFLAIGHEPNTQFLRGHLDIDDKGYIRVKAETRSNVRGVFVAGDVFDHRYRQAVTAAGSGCKAAIDAERWLEEIGHEAPAGTSTNW